MSHHSGSGGHFGGGNHCFGGFHQQQHGGFRPANSQQHEFNYFHQRQNFGGQGTNSGGCESLRNEAWGCPPNRYNSHNRSQYGGYQSRNNPGNYGDCGNNGFGGNGFGNNGFGGNGFGGNGFGDNGFGGNGFGGNGFGDNGFGGGDSCPPYAGQDGNQPPYLDGDGPGANAPERPPGYGNDYHNPQGFENPYSDLEQATQQYMSSGVDSARQAYQRAIGAADAISPDEVRHDAQRNQQREAMLSQQEQMMERNGASPQQMQAVEQQRRMLQQQDQQLQLLYLAPGVTRANFGFALIASGDVAEGEQMVQQALKLRPEMANDPRFQHALQDALRRGGAAGGSDRDPYKYSGPGDSGPGNSGSSPYAPPPPGSDTGTPPLAPAPPGTPGDTTNPPLAPPPRAQTSHWHRPPRAQTSHWHRPPRAQTSHWLRHPWARINHCRRHLVPISHCQRHLEPISRCRQHRGQINRAANQELIPAQVVAFYRRGKPHDDSGSSVWQWLLGAGGLATGLAAVWAAMKHYAEKTGANEKLKSSFDQDGIKFSDDRPFKAEKQTKAGEVDIDGKKVKFEEGDYIVTGPDGKKEVVAGKDFDSRFKSNGQSEYLEKDASTVKAKKLTADTPYLDADGRTQTAKAGDWLVLKDGQLSSVKDAEFTNGSQKSIRVPLLLRIPTIPQVVAGRKPRLMRRTHSHPRARTTVTAVAARKQIVAAVAPAATRIIRTPVQPKVISLLPLPVHQMQCLASR